ncbi:hypothetical protein [Clostridium sp.]|uniref:hypothetical protein n=1 Tax=Clostridium sp. TaxID=1506 RepID=UPI00262774D4|nr:hypothetical protein [uncultured Clostridium sp.]
MNYTYKNSLLTPMERTLNLLSLMTLEEKVGQMMQISYNMVTVTEAEQWAKNKFAGSG